MTEEAWNASATWAINKPIYTTNIDRPAPIACLSHRVNCPAFNTASVISAHLTYGLLLHND